jgi:DNA-binding Lrp family transcriptional regulator
MKNTMKKFNLDKITLDIVKEMQPISAEEIWMEIEEDLNCTLTRTEVSQQLKKMVKEKILKRVKLKDEREGYKIVKK